jgi:hypothetical protein
MGGNSVCCSAAVGQKHECNTPRAPSLSPFNQPDLAPHSQEAGCATVRVSAAASVRRRRGRKRAHAGDVGWDAVPPSTASVFIAQHSRLKCAWIQDHI